jgi:hypothetical protein
MGPGKQLLAVLLALSTQVPRAGLFRNPYAASNITCLDKRVARLRDSVMTKTLSPHVGSVHGDSHGRIQRVGGSTRSPCHETTRLVARSGLLLSRDVPRGAAIPLSQSVLAGTHSVATTAASGASLAHLRG